MPSRQPQGSVGRMLLIDDERSIAFSVSEYFRRLGWHVETADTPQQARALLDQPRFDVVLLDLRLEPHGEHAGIDILRWFRRMNAATPVIVLSAYVSPELEKTLDGDGADAVVRKPQSLARLRELVGSLTRDRTA